MIMNCRLLGFYFICTLKKLHISGNNYYRKKVSHLHAMKRGLLYITDIDNASFSLAPPSLVIQALRKMISNEIKCPDFSSKEAF